MSPGKRSGAPPQGPATSNYDRANDRTKRSAAGVFYPPTGRRHLGAVIVRGCPRCGFMHLHRAVSWRSVDGTTRVGSCGAAYVLRVARIGGVA